MTDIEKLENYLEKFCSENSDIYNHNLIEELDFRRRWQVIAAAQLNYQFDGKEISIAIGLDSFFPHSLPHVFLIPWDRLGFIPHVEPDGWICYAQKEGLVLNSEEPYAILNEAIEKAILILEKGVNGENNSDFVDEFESYWAKRESKRGYVSYLELNDEIRKIYTGEKKGKPSLLFNKENDRDLFFNTAAERNFTTQSAIYIPLDNNNITPPPYDQFWKIEQVRGLIWSNLKLNKRDRLLKVLSGKKLRNIERVFVSIPRNTEGKSIFGLEFRYTSNEHPLLENGQANDITPLEVNRRDRSIITARSGDIEKISHKKVLLVGCGSVGGFIATELARTGIRTLTLVDHEKMKLENIYRHALGMDERENYKVKALKKELERKIPYIHIKIYPNKIEKIISEGLDLENFDLIISAIGEFSVDLFLNKFIIEKGINTKVIFTWLEPYGIGGHALLMNNSAPGCLRCLFTYKEINGRQQFYNRASFAAAGQTFFKSIDGCGNTFTPYGSLSAIHTAQLATKLAIKTLRNNVEGNPLRSWKGAKEEFIEAGFKLSNRFNQTEENLFQNRYKYIKHDCKICNSGT